MDDWGWILTVMPFAIVCVWFVFECWREHETRALKIGLVFCLAVSILVVFGVFVPSSRPWLLGLDWMVAGGTLLLLVPASWTMGQNRSDSLAVGAAIRPDERDTVFARRRLGSPESPHYRSYYDRHPEWEDRDAKRRTRGVLGQPGRIDGNPRAALAMMGAGGAMSDRLAGTGTVPFETQAPETEIGPQRLTASVKALARRFGADLVGVGPVQPQHVYSQRGFDHADGNRWGQEIASDGLPPRAVVFAVEMDWEHNSAAPHTATTAESVSNYGKGAYIAAAVAEWIRQMGYRAVSQTEGHYDMVMPPLAESAGLGEVGRLGYLIAPKFGARVRIFAVLTDMPLVLDRPQSLGVDAFCRRCLKCAEVCPSRSIPRGNKVECRGVQKWKLDADSCFDYWAAIGTDCGICMAVCPFSRPNTWLHSVVRWFVRHSLVARLTFPVVDNVLYGRRWHSKPGPEWLRN